MVPFRESHETFSYCQMVLLLVLYIAASLAWFEELRHLSLARSLITLPLFWWPSVARVQGTNLNTRLCNLRCGESLVAFGVSRKA